MSVKKIKQAVINFLRKYRMDYLDIDAEMTISSFVKEMEQGLAGRKSTLDMIPTYIEVEADVPANKRAIVADAGGTNFRIASVYFDNDRNPVIEKSKLFAMPGAESEISKEDFFRTIAGYLKDIEGESDKAGLCFSYEVEILPNRDGRLLRFAKEVRLQNIEGELLGENLNRAIITMGISGGKHIVVLNDSVATLLAGVGFEGKMFSTYIGFILGTGTNCCYVEKNVNIKKKKDLDPSKNQIINTESGCFEKLNRGKMDVLLDKSTLNPGFHKFEKMISGAYLGALCLLTIHKACDEKLFSAKTSDALLKIRKLETKEMNEFMNYPYGDNPLANCCKKGGADDALILYYIADRLCERAAKLTAINITAAAVKSGCGTDPTKPICIAAEGTTFYQMKGFKSRVEFYLKQYLENKRGIYWQIIKVDNATLIGAAIAALTN